MSNRKLFKIVGFVGIITVISKIFGLIRDLVVAQAYGTSIYADAYNFAYLLTGNALVLLGGLGGPFHSATITILSRIKDSAKESGSFLIKIFSSVLFIFFTITILILIFKTQLVHLIAPGNGLSEVYRQKLWELTTLQLQIMSPLIIISGVIGILCGISNIYGNYFWPSFGPLLPSLGIILTICFFNGSKFGLALGIGTVIGSVLQLLLQLPDLIKAGLFGNLKFTILKDQKSVSDFYLFLGPALLSTTIGQLTVYIDSFFCSGLEEGSWTATVFANRLIQLPLGVLLTSFLVPFFPRFSELSHSKDIIKLKEISITVIRSLWFIILPIAVFLFIFAKPIVEIIFERGAFDERSTLLTSNILIALLLSMVAYVARDTLTRIFYSLGDSKTPLLIAVFSIIMKIVLNSVLVKEFHAAGIAFATSIVTCFNFILLSILLKGKIGGMGWKPHLGSLSKLCIICIAMLFSGLAITNNLTTILSGAVPSKIFFISISFIGFSLIYYLLSMLCGIEESKKIWLEIKNKFKM